MGFEKNIAIYPFIFNLIENHEALHSFIAVGPVLQIRRVNRDNLGIRVYC